ncbi:MAG: YigZ family protein [Lachnospiraceae bacterium]|nr:YigZ family protein [Lachnospiraceae bacterium]MDD6618319.1 YigZ family protein [Clostridiales bacterium]
MLEQYKTIYEGAEGEIVEKKSRFIATVRLVESEEEAVRFIEEMKKKYWDARHNCHAYVIGEHREITRCSDDGEPSGTAGRPMLDVLLGEDLYNTAVVVTRYFGGTLLGTGGLVRAYSKAVQEGLKNSIVIEKKQGVRLEVITDYNGVGKMQYLAGENQLPILHSEYTDIVKMELLVPLQMVGQIKKAITEATSGRARMQENGQVYFADIDGEIELFDH